jgi:hypothetical protein
MILKMMKKQLMVVRIENLEIDEWKFEINNLKIIIINQIIHKIPKNEILILMRT